MTLISLDILLQQKTLATAMQTSMSDMLRAPTQIIENTYNLYCNPQGKRRLPNGFVPGPYDVVCARGKKAHDSEGNVRFRALVDHHQAEYAVCTCKHDKSKIVSYVVNSIRSAAAYHQGGLVKNVDGLWFEVGDRAAKEKVRDDIWGIKEGLIWYRAANICVCIYY